MWRVMTAVGCLLVAAGSAIAEDTAVNRYVILKFRYCCL